jgi:hypothetical protein
MNPALGNGLATPFTGQNIDLPSVDSTKYPVSNPTTSRLVWDNVLSQYMVSISGAPYVPLDTIGGGITQLVGDVAAGPGTGTQTAKVIGLTETGGPTDLGIAVIPPGTALIRSGSGNQIIGVPIEGLGVYEERTIPFDVTFTPSVTGYFSSSINNALVGVAGNVPSYPLGVAALKARLIFRVNNNALTGTVTTLTFQYLKNAVVTDSVGPLTSVANGTLISTAYNSLLGPTAATDYWQVTCVPGAVGVTGTLSLSGFLIVGYLNLG